MDTTREISDLRNRLLARNKDLIQCLEEKIKLLEKVTELGSIIRTQYGAIHQMTVDADKGNKAIAECEVLQCRLRRAEKDKEEMQGYYQGLLCIARGETPSEENTDE